MKVFKRVISIALGVLIVLLLGFEITAMVSKNNSPYGIPNVFGYSFMNVLTDSMEPDMGVGTGIIIHNDDFITLVSLEDSLRETGDIASTDLIYDIYPDKDSIVRDEEGNVLSYTTLVEIDPEEGDNYTISGADVDLFRGDIVTGIISSIGEYTNIPISHRLIHIDHRDSELTSDWTLYCMGDNLFATDSGTPPESGRNYRNYGNTVTSSNYVGRVKAINGALGWIISVTQQQWFMLVAVVIPLMIIVVWSAVDLIKAAKMKEENPSSTLDTGAGNGDNSNKDREQLMLEEKERLKAEYKLREIEKRKIKEELRKKAGEKEDDTK